MVDKRLENSLIGSVREMDGNVVITECIGVQQAYKAISEANGRLAEESCTNEDISVQCRKRAYSLISYCRQYLTWSTNNAK